MDESDWELLRGMRNCYVTCEEDFAGTVRMVARSRGLKPADVKARLARIAAEVGHTDAYRALRAQLPPEFPL